MSFTDKAEAPRKREGLDTAVIEPFLKENIPGLSGTLTIRQFPSGYSNLSYLLTMGGREFVLRRPPFGTKAKSAHDMGREFRVLSALRLVYPYCPKPLAYTEDTSIMDSPFYVMERINGIILRRDLPPGFSLTPAQAAKLFENLLEVQLELHNVDYKKIGLENLGKPQGYVERQVMGSCKRYRAARTPDAPDCEEFMAWLQEKMPPDTGRPAVIHNDFKLDNVVLDEKDPLNIIGVLDWELTTIGDPLMDLGLSLSYWVQPGDPPEMEVMRTLPTNIKGALTREQMRELYEQKTGRPIDNFDFYYCFGLFRMAVVVQQMY
ncbi:MAG: phosphotransferase family protein, partial [Thermodesulfobacteriota bacterium]|nr:phosphotransferase family protein [Thermodesulfobacteriota bacterium]